MTECFQIEERDNVATLLGDAAAADELAIRGPAHGEGLKAVDAIQAGHKVALRAIAEGEAVIKYGFPIGHATRAIKVGEWVHLHNCSSLYDAGSSALDVQSGERTETRYV